MSKKSNGAKAARAEQTAAARVAGTPNVVAEFKPDDKGGGTLEVSYHGPLARLDPLWVRVGERRHGEDWLEVRDIRMERRNDVACARIRVDGDGDPLEAASFAFFAMRDATEEVWDSAGRPYGCYVLDVKTREVHPG